MNIIYFLYMVYRQKKLRFQEETQAHFLWRKKMKLCGSNDQHKCNKNIFKGYPGPE